MNLSHAFFVFILISTHIALGQYCKQHNGITAFMPRTSAQNSCLTLITSTHVNINASFESESGSRQLSNSTPNCQVAQQLTGEAIGAVQVSQCLNETQTGFYKCFLDVGAQKWYISTLESNCFFVNGSMLPAEYSHLPECLCEVLQLNYICNSSIPQTCQRTPDTLSKGDIIALTVSGISLVAALCGAVLYALGVKRRSRTLKDDSQELLVLREQDIAHNKRVMASEHEINRMKRAWIIPQHQLKMRKCTTSFWCSICLGNWCKHFGPSDENTETRYHGQILADW